MTPGIFDIIGPVMVGPSSSHTAGAVRLGNMARQIFQDQCRRVDFFLHGSFAQTGQGHGTDRALLGGVMGLSPDDEELKNVFNYAREQNLEYQFHTVDLGDVHPNTVKMILDNGTGQKCTVTGSSIGGGNILISAIDDMLVEFTGHYHTIITHHLDQPGVVARTATKLSEYQVNIAFLRVFRPARGAQACMVIETDQPITDDALQELKEIPGINRVIFLRPVS
jgi:L-serine dehydratase